MIENMIIFVILLYLIATNDFCKLYIDKEGIYLILKKKDYVSTSDGIREQELVRIKTLFKFKQEDKPF